MKVILQETIETLGIVGSEVTVANGYARNFLLPRGKALEATPKNRKIIEQAKKKFDLQIAKEMKLAEEMAERMKGVACKIKAKVHEENRLYGSVTSHDVHEALVKQGVEVERRMILLSHPIKETGTFKVPIRIYKGVEPEITVEVLPED